MKKQRLDNEPVDKDDEEMDTFFEDIDRAIVLNKRGGIGINSGTGAGVCAELYKLKHEFIIFPRQAEIKTRAEGKEEGEEEGSTGYRI
jgi:hypothetical protein